MSQCTGQGVSNLASLVVRNVLVGESSNGRAALYKFTPEWNNSSHIEPLVQPNEYYRLKTHLLGGHSRSHRIYASYQMALGLTSTPPRYPATEVMLLAGEGHDY